MRMLEMTERLLIFCFDHTGFRGNERADRQASMAGLTTGLQPAKAEVLRGLRNFLKTDRQQQYNIDRLKEKGVEKVHGRRSIVILRAIYLQADQQ